MTNTNTDSWNNYTSNFLKTADVKSENDAFVIINVDDFKGEDNKPKIRLTLEKDMNESTFDLNITNATFLKNAGIKAPRNLIGKKLYFKKVWARDPRKNTEVESLRIFKVE